MKLQADESESMDFWVKRLTASDPIKEQVTWPSNPFSWNGSVEENEQKTSRLLLQFCQWSLTRRCRRRRFLSRRRSLARLKVVVGGFRCGGRRFDWGGPRRPSGRHSLNSSRRKCCVDFSHIWKNHHCASRQNQEQMSPSDDLKLSSSNELIQFFKNYSTEN